MLSNLIIPIGLSLTYCDEPVKFMGILNYLVIFHRNGLHIYSKSISCNDTFSVENNNLLTGFLSAITTFPVAIGYNNKDLKSLNIAKTKLFFRYTKNDIIIVIAMKNDSKISDNSIEILNILLKDISRFFEKEIASKSWEYIPTHIYNKIDLRINEIIYKT